MLPTTRYFAPYAPSVRAEEFEKILQRVSGRDLRKQAASINRKRPVIKTNDPRQSQSLIVTHKLEKSPRCSGWLLFVSSPGNGHRDQATLDILQTPNESILSISKSARWKSVDMAPKALISFCIVSYNSSELTRELSVFTGEKPSPNPHYEIIIVDNHSSDGSVGDDSSFTSQDSIGECWLLISAIHGR